MTTPTLQEHRIVIIGGGIIGCTSAYYLTQHPRFADSNAHITLLEASSIAAGASGKAGGLVAKWAYPRELTAISFAEHKRLAEKHDGATRWGWREIECGQWEGRARADSDSVGGGKKAEGLHGRKKRAATGLPDDLDWVDAALTDAYAQMAGPGETAQVHPYEFTTSMLALAQEHAGARLEVVEDSRVVSIEQDKNKKKVVGVTYTEPAGHTVHIPADAVLLAAGPWSPALLPSLPITTTRAHSIVIKPAAPVSPYALFTSIRSGTGAATPEIYARPHGRVYACGPGDDAPLPALASQVQVSAPSIAALRAQVGGISAQLREGEIEVEQACYLPLGGPIVGGMGDVRGLIVATGHTCWGICNAPATGKAVAELALDGSLGGQWRLSKLEPKWFVDM